MTIHDETSRPSEGFIADGQAANVQRSIELWKYFEERGSKLKESMFTVVTWIVGFATIALGFAVKEGFAKGSLVRVENPVFVLGLGTIAFILLAHASIVVVDYGRHLKRTFNRADAARGGESSPEKLWSAGGDGSGPLPDTSKHLLVIVLIMAAGALALVLLSVTAFVGVT